MIDMLHASHTGEMQVRKVRLAGMTLEDMAQKKQTRLQYHKLLVDILYINTKLASRQVLHSYWSNK